MHLFDDSYSYLRGSDVRPEQVRLLAQAAFTFLENRPDPEQPVLDLEGSVRVSVLGDSNQETGIAIRAGRSSVMVTIMDEIDWPLDLTWEILFHEWPCHDLGFPVFRSQDGSLMQPTAAQIERARRCFEALGHPHAGSLGEAGPEPSSRKIAYP